MTDQPARSVKKKGTVFFLLSLLALAIGAGIYWNTADALPPWLEHFLYLKNPPSSSSGDRPERGNTPPSLPPFPDRSGGSRPADAPPSGHLPGIAGLPFAPDGNTPPPAVNATMEQTPLPVPHANATNATRPTATETPGLGIPSILPPQTEEAPPAPVSGPETEKTVPSSLPEEEQAAESGSVVLYSKAKPVTRDSNVVEGTTVIPVARPGGPPSSAALSGRQDQVVGTGFITDLARFMAANYWPAGTHPQAHGRGISTAGLKWANLKYGSQLHGLTVRGKTSATARQEVLSYVLMPSMVKGLYGLYGDRFLTALEREALEQKRSRGGAERSLSGPELREMYGIYAAQMQGLAGAMRTYLNTPGIRDRVERYRNAEASADEAHHRFLEAQAARRVTDRVAGAYQEAVIRREQARENIAASLRRGGSTRGLDTDSLVFSALWLYRREGSSRPALEALASILEDCSRRLNAEGARLASDFSSRTRP